MGMVTLSRTICVSFVIILLINGVEAMDNSKSVMFNVFSGVDFESWLEEMRR
jgi:hypothetical protein